MILSKFSYKPIFIGLGVFSSLFGGFVLFREVLGGRIYVGKECLEGKTVIITGANTGIGKETAREMAKRHARVIMVCRDIEKCFKTRDELFMETRNKQLVCRECDLASQESVRLFAKRINESEPRIDILINNAGVMRCKRSFTSEGIELQLGTNHMGHFLLTMLLLDKIKSCSPSRIVNVSSVAHARGKINFDDLNSEKHYDEAEAYNQSKLANILFTKELAKRLEGTGVTCNALHPGLVNTEITRHMGVYKSLSAAFIVKPFIWLFIKDPRQGAQTTIYTALSSDINGVTGKYFSNQAEAKISKLGLDEAAAKRLWAISEKWTHLSES